MHNVFTLLNSSIIFNLNHYFTVSNSTIGNALPSDIAHFIAHGADQVLLKPVNMDDLGNALFNCKIVNYRKSSIQILYTNDGSGGQNYGPNMSQNNSQNSSGNSSQNSRQNSNTTIRSNSQKNIVETSVIQSMSMSLTQSLSQRSLKPSCTNKNSSTCLSKPNSRTGSQKNSQSDILSTGVTENEK